MSQDEEALSCIASLYHEGDSSALELTHWREVLKAEIEQDIEEQVRLKLGFTSLQSTPITPQSHVSSGVPTTLFRGSFPSRTCLPPLPHHLLQCTDCVSRLEDQDEKSSHVLKNSNEIKAQRAVSFVDTKKLSSRRKLDNSRTGGSDFLCPEVLNYVNSKYGTPSEQLDSLQQVGKFLGVQFDSSGDKTGPLIHCPPEANLCVPTPKHMKTASYHEQIDCSQLPHSSTNLSLSEYPPKCSEPEFTAVSERRIVFNKTESRYAPDTLHSLPGREDGKRVDSQHTSGKELVFESRFESGNLQQVTKLSENEYELKLCPDLYSNKHTQWFYFSVEGMHSNVDYTFHITNFKKPDSLYNYGMKPLLYSQKEAELSSDGWRRVGTNIRYCHCRGDTLEYALSWTMEFPHSGDKCYLCYCYPYHYSQLLRYLAELEQCPQRSCYLKREILCKTLAGNACPLLTITDFQCTPEELRSRPGVVVSARVHPGESNSSWVMEGLIDFLTSDASHAKILRSHFIFLLIPMLNPDGVIVGNYRTSLAGVDLNRVYKNPLMDLFPTVYHTKMLVASTMQQRKLLVYVDLHGHSRKHNVFMYGCHVPKCDHIQFLNERVIPFLLSQQVPNMFSFESCKFKVQRCKESTGRVVTWKMGVSNSFTMEATFCGSTLGQTKLHFHQEDLLAMGHGLGEAIHLYHRFLRSKSYQQKVLSQLAEHLMCSKGQHETTKKECPFNVEPLPDIITSTTLTQTDDKMAARTAKTKRHRTKSLRKFMRCNMDILEEESSTSGSDSENDEFSIRSKKANHKKKRATVSLHAQTQVHLPRLVRGQQHVSTQRVASQTRLQSLRVPKPATSAPAKLVSTYPIRESRRQTGGRQCSWRFNNRYRDRSNGGIPMFSEERNREREERRLQSLALLAPQEPTVHHKPKIQDCKQTHSQTGYAHSGHKGNVLWKPINSHEEVPGHRSLEIKGYHGYSNAISSLVDGNSVQTSTLHLSSRVGDVKEILESWNPTKRLRNETYQTRHISPRLAKFISEMWSNIDDQQKN